MSNLQLWLDQTFPVSYDEDATRATYLPIFAANLSELLRVHGYVLDHRWSGMAVVRWMYKIHCNTGKRYPAIHHRNLQEDKNQFYDVVTDELIYSFLSEWKHIPDFMLDSKNGRVVWDELKDLLWAHVDLDESPQGKLVSSWFESSDTESDGGGKADVYLNDAAAGFHGYWN